VQGDHEKVKELNKKVCNKMGFENWIPVSGQTYPRKLDFNVLSALSGIAQSAYKMASDIRLLASMKQVRKLSHLSMCLHRRFSVIYMTCISVFRLLYKQ
jgi:adenylosuccinate lyase